MSLQPTNCQNSHTPYEKLQQVLQNTSEEKEGEKTYHPKNLGEVCTLNSFLSDGKLQKIALQSHQFSSARHLASCIANSNVRDITFQALLIKFFCLIPTAERICLLAAIQSDSIYKKTNEQIEKMQTLLQRQNPE